MLMSKLEDLDLDKVKGIQIGIMFDKENFEPHKMYDKEGKEHDADTYEDGSNVATTGGFDFSQLQVGDKVEIRFDFNAIPQIANTTLQPAIWYKNRDTNNNVTFTFPLTAQPIFYGTGTVGKTYLNRIEMSVYIASQEDINSLSHFAAKSDNPIIIQPLSCLLTIVR